MTETMTLTADTEHAGTRLDRWLTDTLARDDFSRSRLKALIQEGVKLEDPSGFVNRLNDVIKETL